MPQALRQSEAASPSPLPWFTVEEAALRIGCVDRHVSRQCGGWARFGKAEQRRPAEGGKPRWFVRGDAHPSLMLGEDGPEGLKASLLLKYPEHQVRTAYNRFAALTEWTNLCNGGTDLPDSLRLLQRKATASDLADVVIAWARKEFGAQFRISLRSLQIWRTDYSDQGMEGLVANYGSGGGGTGDGASDRRSPEAIAHFFSIYRTQFKFTIKTSHLTTLHWAKENGFEWPPSLSATREWLKKYDQKDKTCQHREGRTAYSRKFMAFNRIDWSTCEPGFFYTTDHTECDFWCADGEGGTFRPWLTTFIDARSRMIVGWHLGETPHQDAILAAADMAFRKAVPQRLRIDNGKDFTSKLLTGATKKECHRYRKELGPEWRDKLASDHDVFWLGVLGELGIKLIYAKKRNAWAKGLMERWYGTFEDWCARTMPTYTGNSPANRPEFSEELRKSADAPTLEAARQRVAEVIELYHLSPHSALKEQSPDAVWKTATSLRRAVDEQLTALMQARGDYVVRANGVSFKIAGTQWSYGAGHPLIGRYIGRKVFITVDPKRTEFCLAWTPERGRHVFLGRLESNEPLPADTSIDQLRQASKLAAQRDKEMRRVSREAPYLAKSAAQEVAAMQRAELDRLRKTGTDDQDALPPNIEPVRTSFDVASKPCRTVAATPPRKPLIDIRKMADAPVPAAPSPKRSLWKKLREAAQEERQ